MPVPHEKENNMNVLSLQSIFFARHAQHVVLIHFPIALCLAGVLFDIAAVWTGRREFATVAFWNLAFAALSAIPAAITGALAWQLELEGCRLKGVLLFHLIFAAASVTLIWAVFLSHLRHMRRPGSARYRWALEALGVLAITVTGYLGGILSGVNHG